MLPFPPLTLKVVLEGKVNFWATIPGRCLLSASSGAEVWLGGVWEGRALCVDLQWC